MQLEVLRAEAEWQRAGAYSVRIQGMNRQHHIPLRDEFDEHDKDGTRYIVLLDDGYPVATCRFYELQQDYVMLGRVVVLPEYRGKQLGIYVISEAEKWIKELGYKGVNIERLYNKEIIGTNFKVQSESDLVISGMGFIKIVGDAKITMPMEYMEYMDIRPSITGGKNLK